MLGEFFDNDPNTNKKGIIVLSAFISAIVGIAYSYLTYEEIDWLGVILSVVMFTPIWILIIQSLTKK